jgi:hypothetical protein
VVEGREDAPESPDTICDDRKGFQSTVGVGSDCGFNPLWTTDFRGPFSSGIEGGDQRAL